MPKGTDLSDDSQEQLDAIADEIDTRPRKGLWGTIFTGNLPETAAE